MRLADIKLAQMPERAPERCLFQAHRWTDWGPWVPLFRLAAPLAREEPPAVPEIRAYRDRYCRQCGCVERQSYQRETSIIADPHRIERRRG